MKSEQLSQSNGIPKNFTNELKLNQQVFFSQIHGTISDVSTDQQFRRYAPEGGCTNVMDLRVTKCILNLQHLSKCFSFVALN